MLTQLYTILSSSMSIPLTDVHLLNSFSFLNLENKNQIYKKYVIKYLISPKNLLVCLKFEVEH